MGDESVKEKKIHTPMLFDAKDLGESLEEVAIDVIKTESQDITSRWYHSNKDADVFIWLDEKNNIIKQQVSVCGQVVEWNIIEGVRTGFVIEEEGDRSGVDGSEIVHFDSSPQSESIRQAVQVLDNAIVLKEQERTTLRSNFMESPQISNMDPEEFVRRYGSALSRDARKAQSKESWIEKVKRWIKGK